MQILVVKLSSFGDLIHSLPTVHRLKGGLQARITWVVSAQYASLLAHCPDVDHVIPFDRRRPIGGIVRCLREARRQTYDLVVDLTGLFKSGMISRLVRGRVRIGPSYARECSWIFYDCLAGTEARDRHAVEQALDVVRHLGLEPEPRAFPLVFPMPRLIEAGRGPLVVCVPEARWKTKRWPLSHFVTLAARLVEAGIRVVLVGEETPQPGDPFVDANVAEVEDLRGRTSVTELGAILQVADVVVANDTGPIHLAAALGRPVVALMGPTDPERTGPYGPGHRVLSTAPLCSPCFSRVCRNPQGHVCLDDVRPEEVLAAVTELLGAPPTSVGTWPHSISCRGGDGDEAGSSPDGGPCGGDRGATVRTPRERG